MNPKGEIQKVVSGNRITLTEEMRNKLKVKEGDYVIIESDGSKLTISRALVTKA